MSNMPLNTLLTELKSKDDDRYILCMFGTAEHRHDLAALFLFNAELAQIRAQVTEPLLGQIRLQWWRDSLKNLTQTGKHPPHPVLDRFAILIRHGIDLTPLHPLIDAREQELIALPPDTAAPPRSPETFARPLAEVATSILGQSKATADFITAILTYEATRALPTGSTENLNQPLKEKIIALQQTIKGMPRPQRRAAAPLLMHNDLAAYDALSGHHGTIRRNTPAARLWRMTFLLWRCITVY